MREIFSVRFFAAAGVVVGLFVVLSAVFAAGEAIDGETIVSSRIERHRVDLVEQVFSIDAEGGAGVRFDADGLVAVDANLIIDATRSVRVVTGTPGVDLCPRAGELGACALVADLLGDGVVWFALVPMGDNATVDLPAIDVLVDDVARLVNGWEVRYAPILDRRCDDAQGNEVEFASYREFRGVLGDDFTSVYSLDSDRLEAVICRQRVAYAPAPASTLVTTTTTTTATATSDQTGP